MKDGYTLLAAAIVERAVLDYRIAKKNIRKKYAVAESERVIHDVKRFLSSEWFRGLSDLDGNRLLEMLEEVEM